MKILYIHPRAWSGEYPLLKVLRGRGHQICVLEYERKLGKGRMLSPDFLEKGDGLNTFWYDPQYGLERIITWPVDFFFKRVGYRGNLGHRMWLIHAAARHFKPDAIVCSEGFGYGVAASILKRLGLLRPKLIVGFLGGDLLDCPQADVGVRRNMFTRWLLRQTHAGADILRPLSHLLQNILISEGAPPDKIRVCPAHLVASDNVLQETYVHRATIREKIRSRYSIDNNAPVIVSLSGNSKGKGLHVLAEAWPLIKQNVKNCQWLLCGPVTPWIEEQVLPKIKGYESSVHLVGQLQGVSVFEHLVAADLHANPTLCDGLNMVTVEAAAVGVPTVVTDMAGIAAWIQQAAAGTVVPVSDARAIADAVIYFFTCDASQQEAYSDHARRMASEFSLGNVADKLVGIISQSVSADRTN